jgi:hypothetical protein
MDDLGERTSYMALALGTLVIDASAAHVGTVSHVLADVELDVFDGIVVTTLHDPDSHRFADADQVGEIYERGVLLTVTWDRLPEPSENPAVLEVDADDVAGEGAERKLHDHLRRAWDLISGKG